MTLLSSGPGSVPRRGDSGARVLSWLRSGAATTTGELAERTQLSRPTVLSACDALIETGWIREIEDQAVERRGRPSRTFQLDPEAGAVVGIDLGLGHVRAVATGLADFHRVERTRTLSLPVTGRRRAATVQALIEQVLADLPHRPRRIVSIVVGIPSPVAGDRIYADPAFFGDLATTDLAGALRRRYDCDVSLQNDANLCALAEQAQGAARGAENLIAILAGERIGSGVILDGRIVHGARGGTGELGLAGMLSGVAGTAGIGLLVRQAAAAAVERDPVRYAALTAQVDLHAETVFEVAQQDRATRALVHRSVRPISRLAAFLHVLLDPEVIVICGGVADAPGLQEVLTAEIPDLPELRRRAPVRLRVSPLGRRGVVTGAVRAALDRAWTGLTEQDEPKPADNVQLTS